MKAFRPLLILFVTPSLGLPATVVVDAGGGGDFRDIQPALDAARDGDAVLVKAGEYAVSEAISFNRGRDALDPAAPPRKDLVLRSEKGAAETTIRLAPGARPPRGWDRMAVVAFVNGETPASRIEGFTVTGLRAGIDGGGILCRGSSPTIADCAIRDNRAADGRAAAGIWCESSSPAITGCTIEGNTASYDVDIGGGIALFASSPSITRCTIARNSSRSWGGGIGCMDGSSPTVVLCAIVGNVPAAVCCRGGSAVIQYCTIVRNSADVGGAVCLEDTTSATIERCTLAGNEPAAIRCTRSSPRIASCIFAGSPNSLNVDLDPSSPASPVVVRSCFDDEDGPPAGEGNIKADPRFCGWGDAGEVWVDGSRPGPGSGTAADPYRDLRAALAYSFALSAGSPCIGAGEGGADMGAPAGTCPAPDAASRTVRIAAGRYRTGPLDLSFRASLAGAGRDATVIEGGISGLRQGERLEGLTVTGSEEAGVAVDGGEGPEIVDCTIAGNGGEGVRCSVASPRLAGCLIAGNGGNGVTAKPGSWVKLDHCTVAGNVLSPAGGYAEEIYLETGATVELESCIAWRDAGSAAREGADLRAARSCVAGGTVWPGAGNVNGDPRFCGWAAPDLWVDAAASGPADGSRERPFPSLAAVAEARGFGLAAGSPCRGSGAGGSDMGAPLAACPAVVPAKTIHLAAGTYEVGTLGVIRGAAIAGAGPEATVIEGTVSGLTGSLTGVAVTGGDYGIVCGPGETPRIERCAISGNRGAGLNCLRAAPTLVDCTIAGTSGEPSWGWPGIGAGLYCLQSSPVLIRCAIAGNEGCAIEAENCAVSLTGCTVTGNGGGGVSVHAYRESASLTMTDCVVADNRGPGVAVGTETVAVLDHCTITGNASEQGGSGITANGAVSLRSSIVADNYGVSVKDAGGRLTSVRSLIDGNPCFAAWGSGAAVHVDAAAAGPGDGSDARPFRTLVEALSGYGLALAANSPCIGAGEGGTDQGAPTGRCPVAGSRTRSVVLAPGAYRIGDRPLVHWVGLRGAGAGRTSIEGTLYGLRTGPNLLDVTVTGGTGAGIVIGAGHAPEIRACTVTGAAAGYFPGRSDFGEGAGIYCTAGAKPAIDRTTIAGNAGMGVSATGQAFPTLTGCSIRGNGGSGIDLEGGGAVLERCRILTNGEYGISAEGSSFTATDCAIVGNGGGVLSDFPAQDSPHLVNCTIAINDEKGISPLRGGVPRLLNCIVWGNVTDAFEGTAASCLVGRDPLFVGGGAFDFARLRRAPDVGGTGWLPDYIVSEPDLHPGPGSPALDAGQETGAPILDIEGNRRPCGPAPDIGAYETGDCFPASARFVRGDADGNGTIDLTDVVFTLSYMFTGALWDCPDAMDFDDDGYVDLTDPICSLYYQFLGGAPPEPPFPACGPDEGVDYLDCRSFEACP